MYELWSVIHNNICLSGLNVNGLFCFVERRYKKEHLRTVLFLGVLYIYEGELPSQNTICNVEFNSVCTKKETSIIHEVSKGKCQVMTYSTN